MLTDQLLPGQENEQVGGVTAPANEGQQKGHPTSTEYVEVTVHNSFIDLHYEDEEGNPCNVKVVSGGQAAKIPETDHNMEILSPYRHKHLINVKKV